MPSSRESIGETKIVGASPPAAQKVEICNIISNNNNNNNNIEDFDSAKSNDNTCDCNLTDTQKKSREQLEKEVVESRRKVLTQANVCSSDRTNSEKKLGCAKLVIILSGKRKCGKDFVSSLLTDFVGSSRLHLVAVLRIAGPIKSEYSKKHELNLTKLLDSSEYKEQYRKAMVDWSEKYRAETGWNCFLEQAIEEERARDKLLWILNDARRVCDIDYFDQDPLVGNTKVIKLRIRADEETRASRGWIFTTNVDDKPTECGLDNYTDWTHVIDNSLPVDKKTLLERLKPVLDDIEEALE